MMRTEVVKDYWFLISLSVRESWSSELEMLAHLKTLKCPETTSVTLVLASFCTTKICLRSQKWCLTIPKMLPDNWLVINSNDVLQACTAYCQAYFLSRDDWQFIVRHNFWDLRSNPRNNAWRLSQNFFWDCQQSCSGCVDKFMKGRTILFDELQLCL